MSRSDRVAAVIVLLLAVVAALLAMKLPKSDPTWLPLPSTLLNAPHGTRASWLLLGELGHDVTRLRQPWSRQALAEVDVLFVLAPEEPIFEAEWQALRDWLEAGGTLIVAPRPARRVPHGSRTTPEPDDDAESGAGRRGRDGSGGDAGDASEGSDREAGSRESSRRFAGRWFRCARAPRDESPREDVVSRRMGETRGDTDRDAQVRVVEARLDDASPLLAGVEELIVRPTCRLDLEEPVRAELGGRRLEPLWSDEHGILLGRLGFGDGRVLVLGDHHFLSNAGLDEADNVLLLANLAQVASGWSPEARIAFDEMHLGFRHRETSWRAITRLVLTERWAPAMVQLGLVAGLAALAAAVRFGAPRDVVVERRRRQRELFEAGGVLLQRSGGSRFALQEILRDERNRLARLVHAAPDAPDEELAEAAARQGAGDVADTLAACRAELAASPSAGRVLELTRRLGLIREEIEHGRR